MARTPRIIVSRDLIELIAYPGRTVDSKELIRESDGETFIDYLGDIDEAQLHEALSTFKRKLETANSAVRDKLTWLLDYARHRRETPAELHIHRFY